MAMPSKDTLEARNPVLHDKIDAMVGSGVVVVFIKGTKLFPQCGFSQTVVSILNSLQLPYEAFDVLEDDQLRGGIKEYSSWPTIPQVYVSGDFIGGCDIMIEMFNSGELQEMIEVAVASA